LPFLELCRERTEANNLRESSERWRQLPHAEGIPLHQKAYSWEGKIMRENKVGAIGIKCFALLVVLGTACQAIAQNAEMPYP